MKTKVYLCVNIFLTSLLQASATTNCELSDRNDCTYTITCEEHAGSAWNPECDLEPFVTFIVMKSEVDTLTSGFFGSTNFDSRVRIFKAINNTWPNIEATTFRYYSKSVQFDLSHNGIKNIKNEAFRNLLHLQTLNLSMNEIENLNQRSLLISDSRVSDVTVLDLSGNKLSELSGDVFNYLPLLKNLYLQNNKLVTITEDCLANVKELTVLNLRQNFLSSLNMTLITLKSLKDLDVSYNNLIKLSGYELNRLAAIEKLNMSHNQIEVVESNCFTQAYNLKTVDFSYNKIKSPIDSMLFINCNLLYSINFYQNNITTIQENAFKHNSISYLNLVKNNLTGDITENLFAGITNLTRLDLYNQNIKKIRDYAFKDASRLSYLNLSRNDIEDVEDASFDKVNSLKVLDLSYNKLRDVHFFKNKLMNLTELNLRDNNLTVLPSNAFINQTLLVKLDLAFNKIEELEQFSLPLTNIQHLNLIGNRVGGTLKANIFSPANYLRYLDISNMEYTKVDSSAFIDLPGLARLNISHNGLKTIDPNNFKNMDNMYSLDLSYNELSHFYLTNSSLSNLKALYLNNNRLSNVSRTLINMSNLVYIELSYNAIADLSFINFTMLPNLKVLHLSNNLIKIFNSPQTNILFKLSDLSLSSNQITDINLSYFKDLVLVDLCNNSISSINSTFFDKLDYLQSLDLSHNDISQIAPGTFQSVKILKLLNLSHNHVSNLRYGSFKGLHRTEVLDISYNNIAAIDVDVFHECSELRRLTVDYNKVSSLDVDRLVTILPKLTTLSLGGNPVSCKEIVRNIRTLNRSMLRQVEVTSIDKIYHEDNVHGIKCGDDGAGSTEAPASNDTPDQSPSSTALIVWCSLLTILFIGAAVAIIMYRRNQIVSFSRESRMTLRSSIDMQGADFLS